MAKRLPYLDVLKFIGILCIYVGHYTASGNLLHPFVFAFHVPLFFVLSGFTERLGKECGLLKSIYKKIKTILVPFFVFAVVSVVFQVFIYCYTNAAAVETAKEAISKILKGCVRNDFFASSLWFLSCLFLVSVFFRFLKCLRHPALILGISIVVFLIKAYVPTIPIYYNLHYAMYYQLYYTIGYLCFPAIERLLSSNKPLLRGVKWISGLWATGFTALLFFQKNVFELLNLPDPFSLLVPVLTALTAVWFFLLVAYLLQNCTLLAEMGQSTLYFCGSEFMLQRVANTVMTAFFAVRIHNTAVALIVSFVLLLLAHRYLVPIEKAVLAEITDRIDRCVAVCRRRLRPAPGKVNGDNK